MRVLFAGASGFGNVGDDAYRVAFARLLGRRHDLRFDSPYPDLRAVDWCDALVIGGGGLVYCNDTSHFRYMESYLLRADAQHKPIAFSSVGVQLNGTPAQLASEVACVGEAGQIAPWGPWLELAVSVSVRSPLDAALMNAVARVPWINVLPDLAYALRPRGRGPRLIGERATVVIPTDATAAEHEGELRELLARTRAEGRPFYIVPISVEDRDAAHALREGLGLLQGLDVFEPVGVLDLVEGILPYCAEVFTWRYHGLVLARAAGVSTIAVCDMRLKTRFEPEWSCTHPGNSAAEHVALLERNLTRGRR